MKKKALFIASLCAFSLFNYQAQAMNFEQTSIIINREGIVPSEFEIIDLHGSLMTGINPNTIEAGANRNSVYLHFNQSFGNVDVKIYNAAGNLCYNGVVNSSVQPTIIIPIEGSNNGIYTVVLNNANGYAEGDFVKE